MHRAFSCRPYCTGFITLIKWNPASSCSVLIKEVSRTTAPFVTACASPIASASSSVVVPDSCVSFVNRKSGEGRILSARDSTDSPFLAP